MFTLTAGYVHFYTCSVSADFVAWSFDATGQYKREKFNSEEIRNFKF